MAKINVSEKLRDAWKFVLKSTFAINASCIWSWKSKNRSLSENDSIHDTMYTVCLVYCRTRIDGNDICKNLSVKRATFVLHLKLSSAHFRKILEKKTGWNTVIWKYRMFLQCYPLEMHNKHIIKMLKAVKKHKSKRFNV